MLLIFAALIVGALLVVLFHDIAHADEQTVPYRINFQGRLTDSNGSAMAAGTYNMKFRIYDAETAGTLLWTGQRSVSDGNGIAVSQGGLFSVQLGRVSSMPADMFSNPDLYFEIELPTPATVQCVTVGCESYTEGPMTPRRRMLSSPYAFNADQLDGIDSTAFSQLAANNTYTGTNVINTSNSQAFLVTSGSGNLFTADTSGLRVLIGQSDSTASLLVLDTKTTAGDPTGQDGAMYYNATDGKLRCYQGGWQDCIPVADLQTAYDNSASTAVISTTATKGVTVVAGSASSTDLFTVDNTAHPSTTDNTSNIAISYAGGAGAIEGSGMHIDYAPGGTSGSTWSGLRVTANATGAASGVASYGIKLEGPTSSGSGLNTAIKIASGWDIGVDIGSGGIQLANQDDPQPAASGMLKLYAKTVAGRQMLKAIGPNGRDYPLQPSLFQNQVAIINVQSGTTSNYFGTNRTVTGTAVSAAFDEDYGYMSGYSTGTTANTSAGISNNVAQFARGSQVGANGFFANVRGALKDASYSGGVRVIVGMTDQSAANAVSTQNRTGNRAAFSFDSGRGDTNWMFSTKDGTTENLIDTGMPFTGATAYDWYIYTPAYPNNNTIYWRIDNMTAGTSQEGATTNNLPNGSTGLRMAVAIRNLSATAQTISYQRIYVESDR